MIAGLFKTRAFVSPVGLDVGHAAVRAAQLRSSGGRWSVSLVGSCYPPADGAADDGYVAQWLRRLDLRCRTAVVGLSPPDIELHALDLPRSTGGSTEQHQQAARWEIERLMGFPEGTAETSFWPLPESRSMPSTAIGVAAPRDRLHEVLNLCTAARLDCARIDASSCALVRFASLMRPSAGASDVWGVLDLGARRTRLVICVDDTPVLARVFDYGGAEWTARLADSLNVSAEAAERHKRDHGVALVARQAALGNGAVGEMIYNVLRKDIEAMVGEIEQSYGYVLRSFPGRNPAALVLTGGGGGTPNLDSILAEKLGIEVVAPNWAQCQKTGALNVDAVVERVREPLGCFACAIGLAMVEDGG